MRASVIFLDAVSPLAEELHTSTQARGSSAELAVDIAGIADGLGASMIVVGSRGRDSVAGVVLGSTSHNLIKWAAVPVLVVHAPKSAARVVPTNARLG